MNKKTLFQSLKLEIDKQLNLAIDTVQVTLDVATHEENKPENKYDTRGLEASYLARAQSERVLDLKAVKKVIESMTVREFTSKDPIALSALVQLKANSKQVWVLLLPKGGGQSFIHDGLSVKVITPESLLGSQLVGKFIEDSVEIKGLEYEILDIH